jgi:hypothetical protein
MWGKCPHKMLSKQIISGVYMNRHFPKPRAITVVIALICLFITIAAVEAQTQKYNLDNGMEVILKENHGSPMVSSIVFVKSGAKYEARFENGITKRDHTLSGALALQRYDQPWPRGIG